MSRDGAPISLEKGRISITEVVVDTRLWEEKVMDVRVVQRGGSSVRVGDSQEGGKDYIGEILTSGSSGSQDSDSEGWDTNDKVFDK